MILVIAPNYRIAQMTAEYEYKLRPGQWRHVKDMQDVRGRSAKDTTYIWAWPIGHYLQVGKTNASDILKHLIGLGMKEHKKGEHEPSR